MYEDFVAIGNQQPRCHQTQAIGGPGYKNPTHPGKSLKGTRESVGDRVT
jgi:hypothetical protein